MNRAPKKKKPGRPTNEALWASRREQILNAAARLFARHGYSDTDTQLLADELGVGKGTIYRHFPSKRDLFLAAVDQVIRALRRQIDEAVAGITDPLEQVATGVRTYLGFFAEHPDHEHLRLSYSRVSESDVDEGVARLARAIRGVS